MYKKQIKIDDVIFVSLNLNISRAKLLQTSYKWSIITNGDRVG